MYWAQTELHKNIIFFPGRSLSKATGFFYFRTLLKIVFIELYHKKDKDPEDR